MKRKHKVYRYRAVAFSCLGAIKAVLYDEPEQRNSTATVSTWVQLVQGLSHES